MKFSKAPKRGKIHQPCSLPSSMDPVASRVRTASVAATGYMRDFGDTFQPSKRARTVPKQPEIVPQQRDSATEPTLMERLVMEVPTNAWQLSSERSIEQNESFLNDQLAHAALLSSSEHSCGSSITVDQTKLPFAALVATLTAQAPEKIELRDRVETHVRQSMDIISWLLVSRQHELRRHEELMEKLRRADKDAERKQHQIEQLELDLSTLKQQMVQQENTFHAREQALVVERKALQQDKRVLEVTCSKLQGQETAYKTQLRRKDVEYERLKKSLQDAVQRSAKEQRGMKTSQTLNGLTERKQAPAQRVAQSHETLLTKRLIDNLERKRDELLFENEALALNFETLQKQVESVSVQYKKAVQLFLAHRGSEGNTEETAELARVPIDDFTPTPLQLGVKANVPAFIAQTVDKLGDKVRLFERAMQAELDFAATHPSKELVEELKHKLEDAHTIIAEQDRLLQAAMVLPEPTGSTPAHHSEAYEKENIHINTGKQPTSRSTGGPGRRRRLDHAILEQWADDIDTEWHEFRCKHTHVNEERELLQSQAVKLDEDRLAFEMRSFEHFFGRVQLEDDDEAIDLRDVDCPASPRTGAYLRSIGILASCDGDKRSK